MHPQLDSPRFLLFVKACAEVIEALEQCHQRSYLQRCMGLCNNEKEAVTKCLHETRLATQRELIIKSKERQEKQKQTFKKLKEEEYGEDQFLKKLLEREQAKKSQQ